jgi:epoxide hydrolase-like predicted phosphatase
MAGLSLKAIIFDVGGVLIRTQSRAGRERWARRLGMAAAEFENFVFGGESGRAAQLGHKTEAAHWQWLGRHFGLSEAQLAEMRHDFFAGDVMDEALVGYVQRLRQAGYRTGLLSNYSDGARRLWQEVYPFIEHFDGVVISCEVGIMKPSPEIYVLAAAKVGVTGPESLFIDDFSQNVAGARAVGMAAIHFTDPVQARQALVAATGVA